MPSTNTLADVLDRARVFLNDQDVMIWNDQKLLGHARTAYTWLATQLQANDQLMYQKIAGTPFTPSDLPYTGGMVDLSTIIPADMWFPTRLEFRESQSDEWSDVTPTASLDTQVNVVEGTPRQWEWRNRDIYITPVSNNGYIRLTYMSLVPPTIPGVASPVLIDNATECLGFYTAYSAYASRGQTQQAAAMLGSDDPANPLYMSGARGFASMLIELLVKVRQLIPTRGVPFDQGQFSTSDYGPLLY